MERIEEVGDCVGLFCCQRLMARDAEFLLMDMLRDRQGKDIPCRIALLLMGRNGIMNLRLYTMG